jgi:translation initiation factor 1
MPFTIGGDWKSSEENDKKTNHPSRPVKVRKEKRGRAIVTVILNLRQEEKELKDLAAHLKKKCGCGGTVKGSVIEIQGDKVDKVRQELKAKGIKAQ